MLAYHILKLQVTFFKSLFFNLTIKVELKPYNSDKIDDFHHAMWISIGQNSYDI